MDRPLLEAVLITGPYGSGKSTLAAEMAWLLGQKREPHALLDVDFLGWAGPGGPVDRETEFGLTLVNLAAVTANYLAAGIRWYVLAYYIEDSTEVRRVQEAVGLPMRVARLDTPLEVIQQRAGSDPTAGRLDDVREAAFQIAARAGVGTEDILLRGDRPVRELAEELLDHLGWPH